MVTLHPVYQGKGTPATGILQVYFGFRQYVRVVNFKSVLQVA